MRAVEHNDLADAEAARSAAEPGSPAARFVEHEILILKAAKAIGARSVPSSARLDGRAIRICASGPSDFASRCRVYSAPTHTPDGRVSTFRIDGVDLGALAPRLGRDVAQPTRWDAGKGVSIALVSVLASPSERLEIVLQVTNASSRPFVLNRSAAMPFSYHIPKTRVPRPFAGYLFPGVVAPGVTAFAYVAFSGATFGGRLTVALGSTEQVQIYARSTPAFKLPTTAA